MQKLNLSDLSYHIPPSPKGPARLPRADLMYLLKKAKTTKAKRGGRRCYLCGVLIRRGSPIKEHQDREHVFVYKVHEECLDSCSWFFR